MRLHNWQQLGRNLFFFLSPYFLLVGYVGELLRSRKQPGYLPALHKRSKHKVFRSLWHSTQIRGILGAGTSCTWSETKAVGQCLIRKSPPCGVSVHPGKMKLKVFFVFFFSPRLCVFFSLCFQGTTFPSSSRKSSW